VVFSGSCRTSFHPSCAREARHRMEVWAKYGNDNVSNLYFSVLCPCSPFQEESKR